LGCVLGDVGVAVHGAGGGVDGEVRLLHAIGLPEPRHGGPHVVLSHR
ncbi:Os10g0550775, partial [Oryza sativa Japonica Group]